MSYNDEEHRVCYYLQKIIPEVDCGDDPIGFLIASHAMLRHHLSQIREIINAHDLELDTEPSRSPDGDDYNAICRKIQEVLR